MEADMNLLKQQDAYYLASLMIMSVSLTPPQQVDLHQPCAAIQMFQ